MKKLISLCLALSLSPLSALAQTPQPSPSPAAATAQTPQPTPTPSPAPEDDVVRITSNLIQFDAIVLDKNGQQVTDLRPEEFEVTVDGKRQEVTYLSYISTEAGTATTSRAATPADKNAPQLPPVPLKPEQVRRTVALVVDDLGTSFESMHFVREALKKFVDRQMQPGDLVAIMRTSAGMGALQQFTNDKRLLHRAIERVRWTPRGRAGVSPFAPIAGDLTGQLGGVGGGLPDSPDGGTEGNPGEGIEEFREEIFSVGTLGALNYIVRGLRDLPGRKSVVMFSDGFQIYRRDGTSSRVHEALRRLVDLANRASVVVYTMDARGLPTLGLTAADSTAGMTPMQVASQLRQRSSAFFDSQGGLSYLAQETGGFFFYNNNDLAGGLRKVMDDQKGYYLIGFRPDEGLFDPVRGRVRFNKLEVKVKRAGNFKVRTRSGFYGFTDEDAQPLRRTRREQIVAALTSPFVTGEVPVRLTSVFLNQEAAATPKPTSVNLVSTMLHIDVSGFKFTEEADGWHKMVLDVVALTYGENGQIIDEVNRTENVRVRGPMREYLLRNGLVYVVKVPVRKPGAYQLRVAVRDAETAKVGSASQFIEVPDLKKDRLALSGIVMTGVTPGGPAGATPAPPGAGAAEGATPEADPLSGPAVRRMKQGSPLEYFYDIYNAKLDRSTGRPQLQTQMRLFRDGQPVYTGTIANYNPGQQTDMKRLHAGSRLQLGAGLPPGEYVLQVIVTDTLAKGKHRTATQWLDFEIIK